VDASKNNAGYSGSCTHCGKTAAKEVHFSDDGVVVIEKYCAACSEPEIFDRLQKWYSQF
jgi:hypothetical protein